MNTLTGRAREGIVLLEPRLVVVVRENPGHPGWGQTAETATVRNKQGNLSCHCFLWDTPTTVWQARWPEVQKASLPEPWGRRGQKV